ncbi:thiamine diphosphate-binding protein [Mycena galopus ATCC 62051]|nr:thiamine diphosphate-binding protein [Mycena galopus ATCC 62051]
MVFSRSFSFLELLPSTVARLALTSRSPRPSPFKSTGVPPENQRIATNSFSGRYTTAFALFEALWEAGITAVFVNVGSDHPSILEAIAKGKRERPNAFPRMITCPSEVTAISMADGYARITGKPQAVLVHVDVGTQALGQGVHNASVGRVPAGELPGSRTEYMHWLQEAPDQKAIVRQYCRYTGEPPKGPAYIVAAREVLAQELQPYSLEQEQWVPIGPGALPADAVRDIAAALVKAERPLVITATPRRPRDLIPGIRVHDTGGSDVCFPFSHIASEGFRLSTDECTKDADVILLLDCDVPWIPSRNPRPRTPGSTTWTATPSTSRSGFVFPAHGRWRRRASRRLRWWTTSRPTTLVATLQTRRLAEIASRPRLGEEEALDGNNIGSLLKTSLPDSTTFAIEAVTASQLLHDQLQPSRPGSWINCGATGSENAGGGSKPGLVCQVVGDGSFMCAAPSSALWVASKYKIPILTIVLNNGGWKAPRNSAQLVYPAGLVASATEEEINISFRPTPNYAALAEAAAGSEVEWADAADNGEAWMKGVRVRTVGELKAALEHAKARLAEGKKGMLVEVLM